MVFFQILDDLRRSLFQDLRQVVTQLRGHGEDDAVVVIHTERQTAVAHLHFRLAPLALHTFEFKRAIFQHLAIAKAAERLYQSETRIVRQHLNTIQTILCLADGHLGVQRCCLVFLHNS